MNVRARTSDRVSPVGDSSTLTVSVVIPVRDDAELLRRCLHALAQQSHPAHEIIVVDNDSSDHSSAVAEQFGVRVLDQPEHGIPAASAAGYDAARGDIIARSTRTAYRATTG